MTATMKNWRTKSKMHPTYRKVFLENTVLVLRQKARSAGTKRWYCLRKGNLVSALVIHDSAIKVTSLFRENVKRKRDLVYESQKLNGSTCPISLTPISDLASNDIFIHGGVVFSRNSILDYVSVSVDFLNPITRTMMHVHDIKRLRCQQALDNYYNRISLRIMKINFIRQFSFLEIELENILMSLIQQFYLQDTDCFSDTLVAFKETWKEMKTTDRTRTICVLKSLEQSADRFRGRPRIWGRCLVAKYLKKTFF